MGYIADRKVVIGVVFASASYGFYALHYATMKWLGPDYSLWQLIFLRSVVMFAITLAVARGPAVRAAIASAHKLPMAFRGALQLLSMLCFYTAASMTTLAQVMTLYSTAPVMIVLLSVVALRERVGPMRWLAVGVGLVGTVIAANPGSRVDFLPTLLALGSAFFWALTVVFTRQSGARDSSSVQLLVAGVVFMAVSGAMMEWSTPQTLLDWGLVIFIGVQIYLAQLFFYEACRYAPASLVGPLEYTSLVWTTIFGFLLFAEVPTLAVAFGALLVAASGIALALGMREKAGDVPVGEQAPEMAPMVAVGGSADVEAEPVAAADRS